MSKNSVSIKGTISLLFIMLILAGCESDESSSKVPEGDSLESVLDLPDSTVIHLGNGIVRSINPSKTSIVIRHSAIDSFMSAMTMPFPIDDSTVVADVESGDSVTFEISVRGSMVAVTDIEVHQ